MHYKWRSQYGSTPAIATLLALTACAVSGKVQARHDGKSHKAAHEAVEGRLHHRKVPEAIGLDSRQQPPFSLIQDAPLSSPSAAAANGPAGGISNIIAPPLAPLAPSSSAPSPGPSIDPNSPAMPTSPLVTPPDNPDVMSDLPTSVSDGFPDPFPSATSYYFPSTTIQVPIATVCPDTPMNSAIFSILPYQTLTSSISAPYYQPALPGTTSATALLPNGSSTVFLTTTRLPSSYSSLSQPASSDNNTPSTGTLGNLPSALLPSGALPLDAQDRTLGVDTPARILIDSDGCQTVYSPITTALCRTSVRLIGIPDATVTNCDQYVTFSSDALEATPSDGNAIPAAPTAAAAADSTINALMNSLPSPTISDGLPGTYYAAHWYDLVHGGVPRDIRVERCRAMSGPPQPGLSWVTCKTESQQWSVSTETVTTTAISVASYNGPAIFTAGTVTITTSLAFQTTLTLPTTTLSLTVVKEQIGTPVAAQGTRLEQGTLTVQATVPYTVHLEELTRTSEVWVTETSYAVGVETVTRTVGS